MCRAVLFPGIIAQIIAQTVALFPRAECGYCGTSLCQMPRTYVCQLCRRAFENQDHPEYQLRRSSAPLSLEELSRLQIAAAVFGAAAAEDGAGSPHRAPLRRLQRLSPAAGGARGGHDGRVP